MTLSISAIRKKYKYAIRWLLFSIFCLLFSFVYECFSHDVWSISMMCMFLVPLLLGSVTCFVLERLHLEMPCRIYQDSILVLTLGLCINGILEIYGTTSAFTVYYFIAGIVMCFIGMIYNIAVLWAKQPISRQMR